VVGCRGHRVRVGKEGAGGWSGFDITSTHEFHQL
jgi:hypothetical protein